MARTHLNLGENLKPLSGLSDFTIEKDDPDPRGWTVVSSQGERIGTVDDLIVDETMMKVRYLVVDLDDTARADSAGDDTVLVAVSDVDLHDSSRQVVARTFSGAEPGYARASAGERDYTPDVERDQKRLTRSEEELQIGKREVSRGEARVGKRIKTEHVSEPVTRRREEVVVERRPVEADALAHGSISEDEVRVPLKEEELVVEKRPVVKEELVIGKRTVEDHDTVETELRREEFDVETDRDTPRGSSPRRGDR